jgi:hypothetical protein
MSEKVIWSFIALPVELVYRILDHVDDVTLFCSALNVCTRLNTIINNYRRYQVNSDVFKLIDLIFSHKIVHFIQTVTTLILNRKQSHLIGEEFLLHTLQQNEVITLNLFIPSYMTYFI